MRGVRNLQPADCSYSAVALVPTEIFVLSKSTLFKRISAEEIERLSLLAARRHAVHSSTLQAKLRTLETHGWSALPSCWPTLPREWLRAVENQDREAERLQNGSSRGRRVGLHGSVVESLEPFKRRWRATNGRTSSQPWLLPETRTLIESRILSTIPRRPMVRKTVTYDPNAGLAVSEVRRLRTTDTEHFSRRSLQAEWTSYSEDPGSARAQRGSELGALESLRPLETARV